MFQMLGTSSSNSHTNNNTTTRQPLSPIPHPTTSNNYNRQHRSPGNQYQQNINTKRVPSPSYQQDDYEEYPRHHDRYQQENRNSNRKAYINNNSNSKTHTPAVPMAGYDDDSSMYEPIDLNKMFSTLEDHQHQSSTPRSSSPQYYAVDRDIPTQHTQQQYRVPQGRQDAHGTPESSRAAVGGSTAPFQLEKHIDNSDNSHYHRQQRSVGHEATSASSLQLQHTTTNTTPTTGPDALNDDDDDDVDGIDPRTLLANNKSLRTLRAIHGLWVSSPLHPTPYTLTLTSISAHMNSIVSIDGLEGCLNLVYLDLSCNQITSMTSSSAGSGGGGGGGLRSLKRLEHLNLSSNRLQRVEDLECLPNLTTLLLAFNEIRTLEGLLAREEDRSHYLDQLRSSSHHQQQSSRSASAKPTGSKKGVASGAVDDGIASIKPVSVKLSLRGNSSSSVTTKGAAAASVGRTVSSSSKAPWDSRIGAASATSSTASKTKTQPTDATSTVAAVVDDGEYHTGDGMEVSLYDTSVPSLRFLDISANDISQIKALEPLYSAPSLQELKIRFGNQDKNAAHSPPPSGGGSSQQHQQPFAVRENPVCFVDVGRSNISQSNTNTTPSLGMYASMSLSSTRQQNNSETYRDVILRCCPFLLSLDGEEVGYVPTPLKHQRPRTHYDDDADTDDGMAYKDTLLQHQLEQYQQRRREARHQQQQHETEEDNAPAESGTDHKGPTTKGSSRQPSSSLSLLRRSSNNTNANNTSSVLPRQNMQRRAVSCLVHPSKFSSPSNPQAAHPNRQTGSTSTSLNTSSNHHRLEGGNHPNHNNNMKDEGTQCGNGTHHHGGTTLSVDIGTSPQPRQQQHNTTPTIVTESIGINTAPVMVTTGTNTTQYGGTSPPHSSSSVLMVSASTTTTSPAADVVDTQFRRPTTITQEDTSAVVSRDEMVLNLRKSHLDERHALEGEIRFLQGELEAASVQLRSATVALGSVDARVAREVAVAKEGKQKQIKGLSEQVSKLLADAREMSEKCSSDVCHITKRHQKEMHALKEELERDSERRCEQLYSQCKQQSERDFAGLHTYWEGVIELMRLEAFEEPYFRRFIEEEGIATFYHTIAFSEKQHFQRVLIAEVEARENTMSMDIESLTQKLHDAAALKKRLNVQKRDGIVQTCDDGDFEIKKKVVSADAGSQSHMSSLNGMFTSCYDVAHMIPSRHLEELTTRIADLEGICWKHAEDARSSQQQLYSTTTTHQEECEELKQAHTSAIDALKEQLSDIQKLLDVTVDDRDRKMGVYEETQGQLQRTIDNLKHSIEQHDEELSQVESDAAAKINEKRAIISELEDKLETRDEQIAELQAKLASTASISTLNNNNHIHQNSAEEDKMRSTIYAELSDKINEEYQARFETLWEAKAHDVNRQIDAQWEVKEQQFINGPRRELLELIEALRNEIGVLQEAKDCAESENRHLIGELLPSLRSHILHQDGLLQKQKSDSDAEISRLKGQWARLQAVIAQSSSSSPPPTSIDTDAL